MNIEARFHVQYKVCCMADMYNMKMNVIIVMMQSCTDNCRQPISCFSSCFFIVPIPLFWQRPLSYCLHSHLFLRLINLSSRYTQSFRASKQLKLVTIKTQYFFYINYPSRLRVSQVFKETNSQARRSRTTKYLTVLHINNCNSF